ncbi:thermonuclease family protein [Flavobacterium oreochromis]|uniref:thermonuclease family protein n=1 Tax=Flavobacterium oreochromis TaxID=2906078 RepID=UPI003859403B
MVRYKLIFIVLLICNITHSQIKGKVVKVKDGDTIEIIDENLDTYTIRIEGIDCPEKSQEFGSTAKKFTSNEIYLKNVEILPINKDKYGRIIAKVLYDKKNLSEELLKAGLAWHYKKFNKNAIYSNLEIKARKKKKGLWIQNNPIPPYQFRKI